MFLLCVTYHSSLKAVYFNSQMLWDNVGTNWPIFCKNAVKICVVGCHPKDIFYLLSYKLWHGGGGVILPLCEGGACYTKPCSVM